MKILKRIGWFLLILLVVLLIASFLISKDAHIESSVEIDAPKNMVYNVVSDLKTHESWNPWKLNDETMVYQYPGTTSGKGAEYTWTSENSGNGSYKFTGAEDGNSLTSLVSFDGQGEGTGKFLFEEVDGKTKATWSFDTTIPWPMNIMNPILSRSMKKSLKNGLNGVKDYVIKRKETKEYNGYKINTVDMPEKYFVMNRQEVEFSNIQQFYANNLGALFGKVQKAGVEMDGMPCGLFFKWMPDQGKTDMAAAIPVKSSVSVKGASTFKLPSRQALQIDYYGDYSGTESAHNAISAYIKDYGLFQDYPVIEEYVTDPSSEKDPKKWLTKITYYFSE